MRNWSRIVFSLGMGALGLAGVLSGMASGCSSASSFSNGPADGGTLTEDATVTGPQDGAPSTSSDTGPGFDNDAGFEPPPEDAGPTSILAVHASANLYDFRLCFGFPDGGILAVPAYPDDPSHPMPETNYPGVPVGGAVLLPALEIPPGLPVTPYAVRAQNLAKYGDISTDPNGEPTCDQLICGAASCLTVNSDYVVLPAVALSSTGSTGTVVLAIEGCLAEGVASGSIGQCGASYVAGTGNLTAFPGTLAPAPADVGLWTMQVAQLSPSFNPSTDAAALAYVDPTIDASIPLAASSSSVGGPFGVQLSDAGVTAGYFVMSQVSALPIAQSLSAVQYFQAPSSDPFTYFTAPTTYFVAVVGDATDAAAPVSLSDGAANPAFDGHGLHVIAYPETAQ